MMGKIYNLIINSNNYFSKVDNNDVIYNVKWDFLPENKKFKVSFNFHSQDITNLTGEDITQLVINFGGLPTTFTTVGTQTGYQTSYTLGILQPQIVSTKNLLVSNYLDNPPIYLISKPNNSQLTVSLYDLTGTKRTLTFTNQYILIINFEEDE